MASLQTALLGYCQLSTSHPRSQFPRKVKSSNEWKAPKRGTKCASLRTRASADDHVTFSSNFSTDLPLYESNRVPFEQYMGDQQRLFNALFPDGQRRERLNNDEWRIHMLPLEFFFLSVRPVVDMRIVLTAPEAGDTERVTQMLTLQATRWDLQGLGYMVKQSDFVLDVKGCLYPERRGLSSRLKGQMNLRCSLVVPPSLALMPHGVIEGVGSAVLTQLLQSMKDKVNNQLLDDYREYVREQSAAAVPTS